MQGWASLKKAAKYADVSERTMRSWMKKGLKYSRLPSGMIRIQFSHIDEFLGSYRVDECNRIRRNKPRFVLRTTPGMLRNLRSFILLKLSHIFAWPAMRSLKGEAW
jgi:hypothetical protein